MLRIDNVQWSPAWSLVDADIFYFFLLGGGEGGVRGAGRWGDRFFIENPRRGGGWAPRERVSAANWGIFLGGGPKYFFRGRNVHQVEAFKAFGCVLSAASVLL